MSTPTRHFGKLSIDTQMPTTRRQAGRLSEKVPDPESKSSSSDEDSSNDEKAPASSTDTSSSPIMSRANKTRDILSTFDADILPKHFRQDIFDRIDLHRTPADCLRPLDLEGTIFQLAVIDHALYKSLSKVQPVPARAAALVQKVSKKIRVTLMTFDAYATNGTLPRDPAGIPRIVKDLGIRLQGFVDIIRAEVPERHPHGADRAADCLFFLLREVCKRNGDAFANNTWGRRAPRGEDEDDRNLFQCLIGHAPTGRPFALDALRVLPEAVLATADKREQLEEIRDLLHRHQAPLAYRRALQRISDPLTGTTSPTAGPKPGQKRPAAGTGRGGQKRTK